MNLFRTYIKQSITLLLLTFAVLSFGQSNDQVFMIGEKEKAYERLVGQCTDILLGVCDNSMETAYDKWSTMLYDIEKYAEKSEFDIKGIKIWINVFWNPDGTVKNIIYYPKPNSKNMNFDDLSLFFSSFIAEYQLDLSNSTCFSHYGSASFPTFAKGIPAQEK